VKTPKALFIINTEFVLLVSFLYYKIHLEKDGIVPVFVLLKASDRRFESIDLSLLPGSVHAYRDNLRDWVLKPDTQFLECLHYDGVKEIVFQNPPNLSNQIIFNHYRNKDRDCRLTLVTDSISIDRHFTTRLMSILFARTVFRKYYNHLPLSLRLHTNHSILKKINRLIAHRDIGAKSFVNIDSLFSALDGYKSVLFTLYGCSKMEFDDAEIIFFSQPIIEHTSIGQSIKKNYLKMLSRFAELSLKHRRKTVLKIHPGESFEFYKPYENAYFVVDPNKNLPAEIILNSIAGKKVVSMWSSISIFDIRHANSHFWLYRLIGYDLVSKVAYDSITTLKTEDDIETVLFR
jgi:hypothetical protein